MKPSLENLGVTLIGNRVPVKRLPLSYGRASRYVSAESQKGGTKMATIRVSNAWGTGLDMSGYNSAGWGYAPADNITGTLYAGYNNIIFDAYGYQSFDGLGINFIY